MYFKNHLFIIFILYSTTVYSADFRGFKIESAQGEFVNDIFTVNANIEYQFNDEVKKALDHGIPLQIDIELKLYKERNWLWDAKISSRIYSFRIEQHPLSNHYLVTDLHTYNQFHFQNFPAALDYIETVKKLPLVHREKLDPGKSYKAYIRTKLNLEELPAPLRPKAYFSPQWRLISQAYVWPIKL